MGQQTQYKLVTKVCLATAMDVSVRTLGACFLTGWARICYLLYLSIYLNQAIKCSFWWWASSLQQQDDCREPLEELGFAISFQQYNTDSPHKYICSTVKTSQHVQYGLISVWKFKGWSALVQKKVVLLLFWKLLYIPAVVHFHVFLCCSWQQRC